MGERRQARCADQRRREAGVDPRDDLGDARLARLEPRQDRRLALALPMMADVTTDFASPPAFMISAKARAARVGVTPPAWNPADEALQQDAYPKVQPILVDLEPTQAYQLVLRVTKDLGWKIVDANPPNLRVDGVAQIEAIARSPVFGFADDIAMRVRPLASQTRIDLRSVSRVGRQDFGANARHLVRFAAALQDALQEP